MLLFLNNFLLNTAVLQIGNPGSSLEDLGAMRSAIALTWAVVSDCGMMSFWPLRAVDVDTAELQITLGLVIR